MWDGLTTNDQERVVVLAATNRPQDLDDAVLRRLPRRMLVDLPNLQQREEILSVICRGEDLGPDVSLAEVARFTEGYSGSDLKNCNFWMCLLVFFFLLAHSVFLFKKKVCVAAAFVPVREILEREKSMGLDPHRRALNETVVLRPLMQRDFEKAKEKVVASVSDEQTSMSELREWNATFGSEGDRRKRSLPYFL
jgi:SpoVK/Ycf46/Vps4 family AAA+-type ATPase